MLIERERIIRRNLVVRNTSQKRRKGIGRRENIVGTRSSFPDKKYCLYTGSDVVSIRSSYFINSSILKMLIMIIMMHSKNEVHSRLESVWSHRIYDNSQCGLRGFGFGKDL